jgi:hypothetical protein
MPLPRLSRLPNSAGKEPERKFWPRLRWALHRRSEEVVRIIEKQDSTILLSRVNNANSVGIKPSTLLLSNARYSFPGNFMRWGRRYCSYKCATNACSPNVVIIPISLGIVPAISLPFALRNSIGSKKKIRARHVKYRDPNYVRR